MNYRHVDPGLCDYDLLYQLAYWHNETPKLWIKDYIISEEDIQDTLVQMRENDNYIGLAEDEQVKGFIWVKIKEKEAAIISLYVSPDSRKKRIGTTLKILMESWCKEVGVKKIKTTVHSMNQKMISINKGLGYQSAMIHMEKIID